MKRVIFSILCVGSLFATSDEVAKSLIDEPNSLVKEYQEMFKKISEKRDGLSPENVVKVKSPFIKIVKKKKGTKSASKEKQPEKVVLILDAIVGKKAMINGVWYKLNQKIADANMKLVAIKDGSVLLQDAQKTHKLTIRKENANIIIK